MFGYLRPLLPELKVREAQLYRAVYCGVCRAIGKNCGHLSRLYLQYDAAVLALLWLTDRDQIPLEKRACILHPGVAQPIVADDPALDAAARACVLLAYFRAQDAVADEKDLQARGALGILGPAVRHMTARNAAAQETFRNVEALVREIGALEQEGCSDMDRMAELSGQTVAQVVMSFEGIGEDTREPLRWMGLQLGRWLYLVDALDDQLVDAETGAYNVLRLAEGSPQAVRGLARETAQWAAMQAANAFDLLPEEGPAHGILYNLLYAGMPSTLERVAEHPRDSKPSKGKGGQHAGSL